MFDIHLSAAFEVCEDNPNGVILNKPEKVFGLMAGLGELRQETFCVLLLNTKNRLQAKQMVSLGTLNSAPVHPREVFRPAIEKSAAAMILVHNHPSGECAPSSNDIALTQRLVKAGDLLGIEVLDHVIIGRESNGHPGFCSLRESGFVEFNA
jgi:DNA repair protein RadC